MLPDPASAPVLNYWAELQGVIINGLVLALLLDWWWRVTKFR